MSRRTGKREASPKRFASRAAAAILLAVFAAAFVWIGDNGPTRLHRDLFPCRAHACPASPWGQLPTAHQEAHQ